MLQLETDPVINKGRNRPRDVIILTILDMLLIQKFIDGKRLRFDLVVLTVDGRIHLPRHQRSIRKSHKQQQCKRRCQPIRPAKFLKGMFLFFPAKLLRLCFFHRRNFPILCFCFRRLGGLRSRMLRRFLCDRRIRRFCRLRCGHRRCSRRFLLCCRFCLLRLLLHLCPHIRLRRCLDGCRRLRLHRGFCRNSFDFRLG